jgi:hypothetical protein
MAFPSSFDSQEEYDSYRRCMSKIRLGDSVQCYLANASRHAVPTLAIGKTLVLSDPLLIVGIFRLEMTVIWMVASDTYMSGFMSKGMRFHTFGYGSRYQFIEYSKIPQFTHQLNADLTHVAKIIRANKTIDTTPITTT